MRLCAALLCVMLLSSLAVPPRPAVAARAASAAASSSGPIVSESAAASTPQAAEIGAFLDEFMVDALARAAIPCAVVVVVGGGEILAERGFGYADVGTRRTCAAGTTIFRVASISKLFVWTAVMQLVDAGRLDLDRDVNVWLDFSIEPAFGRPVTLRHLMTHTAGFEEVFRDMVYADPRQLGPQSRFFHAVQPARIFPPGERVAYSNYGAALAAYIVERVTGEQFADYAAHYIFEPLQMRDSTFRQPLPEALGARLASSYETADGPPELRLFTQPMGAGAAVSTGADMARFMLAHLQDGSLHGVRILSAQAARTMRERAWRPVADVTLNSMALGFRRTDHNGWAVVGHGGDSQGFRSAVSLIPQAGLGIFIAMNGSGTDDASVRIRNALTEQIIDRFLPPRALPPNEATAPSALRHAREVAGAYLSTRRIESGLMKFGVQRRPVRVRADENGVLTVSSLRDFNGQLKRWREVAPYVWRQVDGHERLAAVHGASGKLAYLAADALPTSLLEPVPWFRRADWLYRILQVALGVSGAAALLLLTCGLARGRAGWSRVKRWRVALFAVAANVAFVGACVGLTNAFGTYYYHFNETIDPWLRLVQAVGLVALLATLATAFRVSRSWNVADIARYERVSAVVITLAGLYVAWFAIIFNFFSVRLQ